MTRQAHLVHALLAVVATAEPRLPAQEGAAGGAAAVADRASSAGELHGRLRAIRIETREVFPAATAAERVVPRLLNALHVTTLRSTIALEIWFAPGDEVDAAMAAELERNLRRLDLFAEVSVRLVETSEPGTVDLVVTTRDRFTLFFGAGGSYVGGVAGVNAAAGESNLFGRGDRVAFGFRRNSDGEYRGSVSYRALHLFDSWLVGDVGLSRTDEGDSLNVSVRRPFKHLSDPRSWSTAIALDENEVDYYRNGDVVAEVPQQRNAVAADIAWGEGPVDARDIIGLQLGLDRRDYDPATGPLAPQIRVPGDTTNLSVSGSRRWDRISGYREVTGLDTLDYEEDLTLGTRVRVAAGLRWRDEDGRQGQLEPELAASAGWSGEPLERVYANASVGGGGRLWSGNAVGWNATSRAQVFAAWAGSQTAALSVAFDAVEEDEDLPVELTLGEDNGLRGYDARQFSGTRRLRVNLEERYDTGFGFWTLRFGLCGFADAGWVGEGSELGRPYRSVGVGLRVGSRPLLGASVVRVDLAYPLDDAPFAEGGWSVSLSVGQVFTFGGNASDL